MGSLGPHRIDYDALMHAWSARAPWFRRWGARIGLQGKLVLCFTVLLSITIAASLLLYMAQSRAVLARVLGDQAVQVAQMLAVASSREMATPDAGPALRRIGQELIRNPEIVGIAFHDPSEALITFISRDPDAEGHCPPYLSEVGDDGLTQLARPRYHPTRVFGTVAHVTVPVLGQEVGSEDVGPATLRGFATVSLAQVHTGQLFRVQFMFLGIGLGVLLLSVPPLFWIVHRIFQPIRELVAATERIAAGNLAARVDIHRPDVIGTLARSFNDMLGKVKAQQDKLAVANGQLAAANRDLEQKVQERTAQFEAANKRLSSEIAEKEAFLRAVSHDLNAPLRNIAGMTSMLLMKNREKFDRDTLDRLERISRNVKAETDLIAELLELSRIKSRRLKAEPVEVSGIVHELRELFDDDLKRRQIDLVVDTPLPVIHGERARLRQVFLNLIDNAIKYMGDGPTRAIHVGCGARTDEVEFYVRDTGVGIDPPDAEKVFHVFRRGKSQVVQAVAGKGVGLASVKSIVETYSGSIWVESAGAGHGTTFRFTVNGRFLTAGAIPQPSPGDSMAGASK